jgi:hypothetical protein
MLLPHGTVYCEMEVPEETDGWRVEYYRRCLLGGQDRYDNMHGVKLINYNCFFNWAPRHEGVLGEFRYSSTHSLTSALDGGEWSASRLGRFTPRERAPDAHWIGGWLGPTALLDAVMKRKIPAPCRESNPRTPIVQPVAQRYTDWAITALKRINYKVQLTQFVKLHSFDSL